MAAETISHLPVTGSSGEVVFPGTLMSKLTSSKHPQSSFAIPDKQVVPSLSTRRRVVKRKRLLHPTVSNPVREEVTPETIKSRQKVITSRKPPVSQKTTTPFDRRGKQLLVTKSTLEPSSAKQDDTMGWAWMICFFVITIIGVLSTLLVLLYLLIKMCSNRMYWQSHHVSISLLFPTIMQYLSVIVFLIEPVSAVCSLRFVMHPMVYSLNFGIIIVHYMHALSFIPTPAFTTCNSFLILIFILSTQASIVHHWSDDFAPTILEGDIQDCSPSRGPFLLSHVYVGFLLILALALAIRFHRQIAQLNRRPPLKYLRWYLLVLLINIPIFLGWTSVYFLAGDAAAAFTICVALLLSASSTLLLVYAPLLRVVSLGTSDRHSRSYPQIWAEPHRHAPSPITSCSGLDSSYASSLSSHNGGSVSNKSGFKLLHGSSNPAMAAPPGIGPMLARRNITPPFLYNGATDKLMFPTVFRGQHVWPSQTLAEGIRQDQKHHRVRRPRHSPLMTEYDVAEATIPRTNRHKH